MARHMGLQMMKLEGKLRTVDMVIEVHDARVALSGRNPNFTKKLISLRPHILVLNKRDLIDMKKYRRPVEEFYQNRGIENIVWTDCKQRLLEPLRELREKMMATLNGELRFNRTVKTEYQVMVVGIPNVGKSSLINSLRMRNQYKARASREGSRPGVTLEVQTKIRILDAPLLYMLDTPGIIDPWYRDNEEKQKLTLCNLLTKESASDPISTAGYLLEFMNKNQDYSYCKLFELPEEPPYYDVKKLLAQACEVKDYTRDVLIGQDKQKRWRLEDVATEFIYMYRKRRIEGDCFLDRDLLA